MAPTGRGGSLRGALTQKKQKAGLCSLEEQILCGEEGARCSFEKLGLKGHLGRPPAGKKRGRPKKINKLFGGQPEITKGGPPRTRKKACLNDSWGRVAWDQARTMKLRKLWLLKKIPPGKDGHKSP